MDDATLVPALIKFLTPFIPFLIKGTEEAAKEAGKKFGSSAWDKAGRIWDKIPLPASSKESAKALPRFSNENSFQALLRHDLENLLKDQPVLTQELLGLIQSGIQANEKRGMTGISVHGNQNKVVGRVNGESVDIRF